MRIKIIIIMVVLGIINVKGQSPNWVWAKSAGAGGVADDMGRGVDLDSYGNLYVYGMFQGTIMLDSIMLTNTGGNTNFITKYDANGGIRWAKKVGGTDYDYINDISVDAIGNVYVTGFFNSSTITIGGTTLTNTSAGADDIFIAKYDSSGNVLWAKKAGGTYNDGATGIATDNNGNSYITGAFFSSTLSFGTTTLTNAGPNGSANIFIAKYSASGNLLWAKRAGGTLGEVSKAIAVDNSGNAYITGFFDDVNCSFGSSTVVNSMTDSTSDFFLVKYNTAGNVIWAKSAGGNSDEGGSQVIVTAQNNIYIGGGFSSTSITFGTSILTNNSAFNNMMIAKYDSTGNVIWAKTVSGAISSDCIGIDVDLSENLYATGFFHVPTVTIGSIVLTSNNTVCFDVYNAKYDPAGNVVWANSIGSTDCDYGNGIAVNAAGNAYVTGGFYGSSITFGTTTLTGHGGGYSDIFIAKMDNTVALNELTSGLNSISLYPNPTHSSFTLTTNTSLTNPQIEIYNMMGAIVYSEKIKTTTANFSKQINLNASAGIYFVKLSDGEKQFTKKLVVE